MTLHHDPSYSPTVRTHQNRGLRSLLRTTVAAALFAVGAGATAQVSITVDPNTGGNWIGNYGSCAYIIPGAQSTPGIEVPIIGNSNSTVCDGRTCSGGVPPVGPGGGNYGGGASNKNLDCQGQTQVQGFSDAITYTTRLCSTAGGWPVPTAMAYVWTNPNGQVDPNGCQMQPGYLDPAHLRYPYVLQFPTDTRGVASCTPLGVGCTARPDGRIASTWDDAGELTTVPPQGAGVCVDIDLSSVPAAQRALSYRLSGYFLDYDSLGRDINVQLLNGVTNSLIASSTLTSFQNGAYLNFNNLTPLPSKLTLQINRLTGADVNAVISGIFLDRSDLSSCGAPHITLKKLTNGVDTPSPTDGLAPQVAAGQTVTWTYIATNDGTENLINVNITDNLAGFVCGPFSLAVGASQTCTKTGTAQTITVPPGVAGTCGGQPGRPLYENMGNVVGTGQSSGQQVTANYLSHYCNPPAGGYTLVKSPKNATYNMGDNVSFVMTVNSTGPGTANNVVLSDPLPTLGNLSTWTITSNPGGCSIASNTLTCNFGNLAQGASRSVTVATNTPGGANAAACPGGVKLNNTATVTGDGLPTLTDTGDYTCTPGSFTLVKTPKGATYSVGQNVSFNMVVTSTGPGTAVNVVLTDPLPTLGNLNSWIITSNPGGCSIVSNNLTCNYGNLANGQSRTVTVATNAAGGADASACPGGVTMNNTATVTSTGLTPKTDTGDYSCTPPPAGVTLVKTPKNATYTLGQNISFSMVVTSTGPGTANNVVLSDPLPTLGNLNSWTITSNPGGCSIAANNLTCNYGNLASGATRTVTVATNVSGGANASACPGGVTMNNTATVTATGLPTKTDTGDYTCTPTPNVTIIKFTNGADANDPNAAGVPTIAPGGTVTWTYRVTNTGQTSVPAAQVLVTDSTTGVTPTFTSVISGNADSNFDPGEVWLYTATGTALDLTLPPPNGVTTMPNSCSGGGVNTPSTAYTNIGRVQIPGAQATDPSSYCNPPPSTPCPAGSFTFSMDANGNLNMKFDQFPAPNDNSYGANAVGWGTKGHTFGNLTGSDKAGFQIVNPSGTVVLDFNIDYLTATTASAAFPSGYKSFGPFGGDGKVNVGSLIDQTDITYTTSLANNLNNVNIPGLFSNGVQQFGTSVANVLVDSPPTLDKISNYTLTPAAISAGFTGWDFHDTYFVTLKKAKLVAIGAVNAATNQLNPGWKVQPNLTALHNSPAKPCPGAGGGGTCDLDAGPATTDKKLFKWEITNSGTATATLTDVQISWPSANGNLNKIKLAGNDVYTTPTPPASVTLTTAQLVADPNKRKIDKGKTVVLQLEFQNNVAASPYLITLKFGTDASCVITFDSSNQTMNLTACSGTKPIQNMVLEYSGTKAISNVAFYRTSATGVPGAADKIGDSGPLAAGDIFSFGDYAAYSSTNDVDFQITFTDNTTQKSRFHLSCSDPEMQDIADCGKVQGNGKDNSIAGGNLWLLRDLQGQGNHMCNFP